MSAEHCRADSVSLVHFVFCTSCLLNFLFLMLKKHTIIKSKISQYIRHCICNISSLPLNKYFTPTKYSTKKIRKTIFMRYRQQSVQKTLYKTYNIRPSLHFLCFQLTVSLPFYFILKESATLN